ncbi:unnamed protein product, partial [Phaeothamnion confervicola]
GGCCPSLAELELDNCRLSDHAIERLAAALATTHSVAQLCTRLPLSRLSVQLTTIKGRSAGVQRLAEVLSSTPALRAGLESLSLRRGHRLHHGDMGALLSGIGGFVAPADCSANAVIPFGGELSQLRSLNLSENLLSNSMAPALVRLLERCPRLEALDISYNALGDEAIAAVGAALARCCPRLKQVRAGGNRFGDAGAAALLAAVT